MKTISVIAYNRPAYLRRVLEALEKCRGVENYKVFVSVDDAAHQLETLLAAHGSMPAMFGHERYHVWAPRCERLGVDWHPKQVYDCIFDLEGSDFNVMLEDDTVPSPDALELADWFCEHGREYAYLSLHNGSTKPEDPTALEENMRFCPWGWACTREMWQKWFAPNWNCKVNEPAGWDWSMGVIIQRNGLKCLNPRMSRTLNIGREGGVYETPDHFDSFHGPTVAHDGSPVEYRIASRLPAGYETDVESWVKEAECPQKRSSPC
jgi:hypothetical protein